MIAPVDSFHRRKARLAAAGQPSATTQAFWNGNYTSAPQTTSPPATIAAAAAAVTAAPTSITAAPVASSSASPSVAAHSTPSSRPRSTFLQRYLRRHGPSVHHVAFLVPNLRQARERFRSFGYSIYGWSDRDPLWKECQYPVSERTSERAKRARRRGRENRTLCARLLARCVLTSFSPPALCCVCAVFLQFS